MPQDKDDFIQLAQRDCMRIAILAGQGRTQEIETLATNLHRRASIIRARGKHVSMEDVNLDELPANFTQSEKTKTLARALRYAVEAAQAVDLERGYDRYEGYADFLDDIATDAEEEAFGPMGTAGLE